jgi:predicted dehydrogenase
MMKVGIIGFGSIGKRHCTNLITLGINDITLFREMGSGNEFGLPETSSLDDFLQKDFDFVIITNPTSEHFRYLKYFINKNLNILVEKPIAAALNEYNELSDMLSDYKGIGFCAYNMRFHPIVKQVNYWLNNMTFGSVYSARFFVGQYLPDWRPQMDYRKSYSASSEMGGGAVLDLSHEIDLAFLFFGSVKSHFHSICSKVSNLEISAEDLAEIHYVSASNTVVSIHLDYLTRGYSRYFEITTEAATIRADFKTNKLTVNGDKNEILHELTYESFNRNDMYFSLVHYYLDCLSSNITPSPGFREALEVLKISLSAKEN